MHEFLTLTLYYGIPFLVGWMFYVRWHRFDYFYESQKLDPKKDYWRMIDTALFLDSPFLSKTSLELALFQTFGIPSISELLERTRQFTHFPFKRFEDTDLLIREYSEHDFDSERAEIAFRRVNYLHSRYKISKEDYVYVLSTFIFAPIDCVNKYGWREITQKDREASYYFMKEIGKRLGVTDIPPDYQSYRKWADEYEQKYMVYSESNKVVAEGTLKVLENAVPRIFHPLIRPVVCCLISERLNDALGYPRPSPVLKFLVYVVLKSHSLFVKWFLPPRPISKNLHRTSDDVEGPFKAKYHTYGVNLYPNGYRIEELGPENAGKGKLGELGINSNSNAQ